MRKSKTLVVALLATVGVIVAPAAADAISSYHYDTDTIPASHITVSTPSCTGGGLNLTTAWRNRIDATQSNCRTYHYDQLNYSGFLESTTKDTYDTLSAGNRNRTESLKYYN